MLLCLGGFLHFSRLGALYAMGNLLHVKQEKKKELVQFHIKIYGIIIQIWGV